MGWFSSNKNSETDYDSIITTTGDLKQEYSIMGVILICTQFFGHR